MRQLVGQRCVICRQRIGSVLEGEFCSACGQPSHFECSKPPLEIADNLCHSCGGDPTLSLAPDFRGTQSGEKSAVTIDKQSEIASNDDSLSQSYPRYIKTLFIFGIISNILVALLAFAVTEIALETAIWPPQKEPRHLNKDGPITWRDMQEDIQSIVDRRRAIDRLGQWAFLVVGFAFAFVYWDWWVRRGTSGRWTWTSWCILILFWMIGGNMAEGFGGRRNLRNLMGLQTLLFFIFVGLFRFFGEICQRKGRVRSP